MNVEKMEGVERSLAVGEVGIDQEVWVMVNVLLVSFEVVLICMMDSCKKEIN